MKYVVKISEWQRGQRKSGDQANLKDTENGKKCCLGFVCEQHGVDMSKVTETDTYPSRLFSKERPQGPMSDELKDSLKEYIRDESDGPENSEFARMAGFYNDEHHSIDEERIANLQRVFANHGHEIEFID